jgi:diadenylate cyclase
MSILRNPLDIVRNIENPYVAVLDVILVAYIIYRLLLLVRGTRAVQLLKGVAVVVILVWLTGWLQLEGLNWLARQALLPGILAFIIIFQPELRIALERIGRGRFFGRFGGLTQTPTRVVNEVLRGIDELQRHDAGGLIVFERQTGLENYAGTGQLIHGSVSSGLIASLFFPNSPLHDGAAIIRGDQVVAAGCVLPLSDRPSLTTSTGMRHRAAVGLTERTDAVVLVLSEETGQIRLSAGGETSPDLGMAEAKERLIGLLMPGQ